MRLSELNPKFMKWTDDTHWHEIDTIEGADGIIFLCPRCFTENGGPVGTESVICWSPSVPQTTFRHYDGDSGAPLLAARAALLSAQLALYSWDESKHPRHPAGDAQGGEFAPSSGGASIEDLNRMLADLPVKDNPNLRNEATTVTGVRIEIGPKFHALPKQTQREILTHEAAHFKGLDDWYLKNYLDWDIAAKTAFGHFNGQTTPGEVIAEAFSVAWHDPGFIKKHAAFLVPIIRKGSAAVGLPFPAID